MLFNLFSKKTKKAVTSKKSISFRPITSEFIIGYKKKPGDRKIKVFNWEFSKYLIVLIKKTDLAKETSDARPEVFSPGNALDAKITELDLEKQTN